MRIFLILGICCCGIIGCRRANTNAITIPIPITTYTNDHPDYPSGDIEIPDSIQKEFVDNFFVPWQSAPEDLLGTLDALPGKKLSYLEKYLNDDEWYGENKKPHKKWQREAIVNNAAAKDFPNFLKKGIVVAHTDLRRIPTHKPGFDVYSKAGEGYPFDYFQETALWANTPLLIAHTTKDKQWCYVICSYYKGWVSMHDVALVDEDFIGQWATGNYALPLSDELTLLSDGSHYAINAKMGMLLPYDENLNDPDTVTVYFANADENQNATVLTTEVAKNALALDNVKFNGRSLKRLTANLMGKPYGWGGYLENRDCSSMIRDLLGTYKIGLPRDSKDQIEIGKQYELTGSAEEKMQLIKEKGIPFLTILRKKGHNMLYVGTNPEGKPLILHAIWGLKTSYSNLQLAEHLKSYPIEGLHEDDKGIIHGRHIIGEAVITSVTAGKENPNSTSPLIEEIYSMTNVLEK